MKKLIYLLFTLILLPGITYACDSTPTVAFVSYQDMDNGNYIVEIEVCIGIVGSENGWSTTFDGFNVVSFSPSGFIGSGGNIAIGSANGNVLSYEYSGTGFPDVFVAENELPCYYYMIELDGDISFTTVDVDGVNCNMDNCPGSCATISDSLSVVAKLPPLPPDCGENFYDYGGDTGDYLNDEYTKTIICPDSPGYQTTITFTAFDTEECCDSLKVYNGTNIDAPFIAGYAGTIIPPSVTSSNPEGCLTFEFSSDGSFSSSGWEALMTCLETSTNNISETDNIQVFPNPGHDKIQIKGVEYTSLHIVDKSGKIWRMIKDYRSEIDITDLPDGIYFIEMRIEEESIIKKIVVRN